jgi:hypothetical protein
MKRIGIRDLAGLLATLDRVKFVTDSVVVKESPGYLKFIDADRRFLETIGYPVSGEYMEKFKEVLTADPLVGRDIKDAATRLYDTLLIELKSTYFIVLTSEEAGWLTKAEPFGDAVTVAFPSAGFDADEATRCLAFGRGTACVFHLMRVMEVGLKALGSRLGIDTEHKPGWEGVLKKAHGLMSLPNDKKDPAWVKDEGFLSDTDAMLIAVKTAWRNPTMHIEKTYTSEEAERIYGAVKGFMQQLSTKLHE